MLQQGLSDRINLLLFSLAVADLFNMLTGLLFTPKCYMPSHNSVQAVNWDTIAFTKVSYVNVWIGSVSGTLILIMSVDRCLSVVMPLKAGTLLTYRSMLAAIVVTYLFHLAYYLPSFLAFTVKWRVDPSTNHSLAYMAVSEWFTLDSRVTSEIISLVHLVIKPVSVVIVVVCCVITIVKLRQASSQRLKMMGKVKGEGEEGDARETRITKMLLLVCVIYVVLLLPEVSSALTSVFVPDYFMFKKYHNTFIIAYEVILTASSVNSSANVFAYLVMSSKFQRTLKELCVCFVKKSTQVNRTAF